MAVGAFEAVFLPYFYSTPHGAGYELYIGYRRAILHANEARAKQQIVLNDLQRTKEVNKEQPSYRNLSATLKKISVMHVIKLGFAPVSFPPG